MEMYEKRDSHKNVKLYVILYFGYLKKPKQKG